MLGQMVDYFNGLSRHGEPSACQDLDLCRNITWPFNCYSNYSLQFNYGAINNTEKDD